MGARMVAGGGLALLLVSLPAQAQRIPPGAYALRDLGLVFGLMGSALNANGSWAASCRQSDGSIQACGFYNQGTPPSNLRYYGPSDVYLASEMMGINGAGYSVGDATMSDGTWGIEFIGPNFVRWLDPIPGFGGSHVNDINLYGVSVGVSFANGLGDLGLATQWTSVAHDLTTTWPSYARLYSSEATAINRSDTTAGWFIDPKRSNNVTAWVMKSDGVFHDDVAVSFRTSQVTDMNDAGTVVGFGSTFSNGARGWAGGIGSTEIALAPLANDSVTEAHGINNSFVAVGFSQGGSGSRAVSWNLGAGGAPVDLNTQLGLLLTGYRLTAAAAINDGGQILCAGYITGGLGVTADPPGTVRAILLTPR